MYTGTVHVPVMCLGHILHAERTQCVMDVFHVHDASWTCSTCVMHPGCVPCVPCVLDVFHAPGTHAGWWARCLHILGTCKRCPGHVEHAWDSAHPSCVSSMCSAC